MEGVFSATSTRLLPLQIGLKKNYFAKLKVSHEMCGLYSHKYVIQCAALVKVVT